MIYFSCIIKLNTLALSTSFRGLKFYSQQLYSEIYVPRNYRAYGIFTIYVTWSDKTSLIARYTPMCIMVSISCSVGAIQIL